MNAIRRPLVRALLLGALALMAFFGTRLATAAVAMQYRDVPFLPTVLTVSRWSALVALAGVLVVAAMVVLPAALARAPLSRRPVNTIAGFLLLFVLVGLALHVLEIGTVGTQLEVPVLGELTFDQAWLALGAVLAVLAIPAAARRAPQPLGGDEVLLRVLRLSWLPLIVAFGAMVFVLGWVGAGPPPAQGPPGGPGGPGGQPSLFTPMLVGAALTALFALWAGAILARPHAAGRPASAKASQRPADRASEERDVAGMLAAWVVTALLILAVSQLLPVSRTNPPVVSPPAWDSPATAQLWDRTCAACHSNETRWPRYASVAPMSWLVTGHVDAGRRGLNVSLLDEIPADRRARLPDRLERTITSGWMPPRDFLMLHPEARLTADEQSQFVEGLKATFTVPAQ